MYDTYVCSSLGLEMSWISIRQGSLMLRRILLDEFEFVRFVLHNKDAQLKYMMHV